MEEPIPEIGEPSPVGGTPQRDSMDDNKGDEWSFVSSVVVGEHDNKVVLEEDLFYNNNNINYISIITVSV